MNKRYLRCRQRSNGTLDVYYNTILLGAMVISCDGFYCWWPELRVGAREAYILREIADTLDRLNAPWQKQIDEFFSSQVDQVIEREAGKFVTDNADEFFLQQSMLS